MASDISAYGNAVEVIKAAILQAQYAAAKSANAQQLQLYFAVGGYLAKMGEAQKWGSGALDSIGAQLQKELPGLRGFSGRNLRLMRTFYLEWSDVLAGRANLELASADLLSAPSAQNWNLQVPNSSAVSAEEFLSIGFTHHRWILSLSKSLDERLFYIHKCASEHLSVEALKRSIKADDFRHQGKAPNNYLSALPKSQQALRAIGLVLCKDMNKAFVDYIIGDFSKPMGVATYKTSADMSSELLEALPPIEGLKALLEGGDAQ